jgi:PAS domain S-box-containing protein
VGDLLTTVIESTRRRVLDAVQAGVVVQAADGRIVYANPMAQCILGFNQPDAIAGLTSHDERWQAVNEQMEPLAGKDHPGMVALRTGKPVRDFVQGLYADRPGGPVWLLVNSQPHIDDEGRVVEVVSTFLDITAQKRTEQELHESRDQYRGLFDQMLNGFALHEMIFDEAGRPVDYRFLMVNPAFERLTGLKAEEVEGKHVREVLPNIEPIWIELFGQVVLTGQPVTIDHSVADLGRHYHLTAYRPQPGQVAEVFEDITERHAAEQAMRESRDQYRGLFEQMLDGFALHEMILDKRGRPADYRFLAVNPAFERLTGLTADRVIGKRVLQVLPNTEPEWIERYGEVAKTGRPATFDSYSAALDRHFHVTAYRPQIGQFAVIFEDITDRLGAEQQRQLMASELDHRVKNNLAVVLGLAQQAMHSAGDYASFSRQFTRQLQAMARAHEMLAAGHWKSVDTGELIRIAVAPFDESHDRIHLQGKPVALCQCCVLPLTLSLHELATNAVKHGALSVPKGRVHVEWTQRDRHIRLIWRELHGPRVDTTRTPGHGGRLMRGLIEQQLQGKFDLRFEPQGAVAVLELPLDC